MMELNDVQQRLCEQLALDPGHGYVYDLSDEHRAMACEAWLENPGNRQLVSTYLDVSPMSLEYGEVPTDFWDDVTDFMEQALETVKEDLGL